LQFELASNALSVRAAQTPFRKIANPAATAGYAVAAVLVLRR
jgi:hypothetical protein